MSVDTLTNSKARTVLVLGGTGGATAGDALHGREDRGGEGASGRVGGAQPYRQDSVMR